MTEKEPTPLPPPSSEPFKPETGNPENGNYLDWYERLKEGEVVPFPEKEHKNES